MTRPQQKFYGHVKAGNMRLDDRQGFQDRLKWLGDDCEIEVTVAKRRRVRSLSQNAYYWAVVVQYLAEHCGYESEEMHEALKMKFLRSRKDETLPTVRSTTSLDTAEFTEYIEQCRRLAADMGVAIPGPGEE